MARQTTAASKPANRNWVNQFDGLKPRFEACFSGLAYAPHRHDTYTLALTTQGVQSFNYRGELRHSQPGQVVILHPDELHDGQAGTDSPFAYRAINIEPVELQQVLQGAPLPFLETGTCQHPAMQAVAMRLLGQLDTELQALEFDDALFDFAQLMQCLSQQQSLQRLPNYRAIVRAKDFLDESIDQEINLDQLADAAAYSKWQLSRDFRAIYGTSPYRYLTLRRLQKAKVLMMQGQPLAQVALSCHFSDQAHFNRQFKATFGITPKKWQIYTKAG